MRGYRLVSAKGISDAEVLHLVYVQFKRFHLLCDANRHLATVPTA